MFDKSRVRFNDDEFIEDGEKFKKLFLIGSDFVAPLLDFCKFLTSNTNKYFSEELKNGARYLKSQLKEKCPIYLTWSGGNAIQKADLKEVIKKEIPNIEEIAEQALNPLEGQAEGGIYVDNYNIEYVTTGCQQQIVVCNDKILDVTYGEKMEFKPGDKIEIFESTPKVSNGGSVNRIKQTLANNPTFIRRDDKFLADVDEEIRKTEQEEIPGKKELLEEYKKRFIEVNEKIEDADEELGKLSDKAVEVKRLEENCEKILKEYQDCSTEIGKIERKIKLIERLKARQSKSKSKLDLEKNRRKNKKN